MLKIDDILREIFLLDWVEPGTAQPQLVFVFYKIAIHNNLYHICLNSDVDLARQGKPIMRWGSTAAESWISSYNARLTYEPPMLWWPPLHILLSVAGGRFWLIQ